MKFFN